MRLRFPKQKQTWDLFRKRAKENDSIGIELELVKDPTNLIATTAHELSHLTSLGEGRLQENDEELTDLNTNRIRVWSFYSQFNL